MLAPLRLAILLPLAAAAIAQDLRWNLPARGAATYRRELKVAYTAEPKGAGVSMPWYGEANAAVVLAGELDDKGKRGTEPLCDLRDALAFLCLDLTVTKAGKVSVPLQGGGRFQPLVLEASYAARGADGGQEVAATFAAGRPDREAAPVAPTTPKIAGRLQGRRTIDAVNGRIASLQGRIELTVDHPAYTSGSHSQPARRLTFTIDDAWTFERLLSPADPEFRAMVADGIRKAVGAIRSQLELLLRRPKHPPNPDADPHHDHYAGELALYLLALVKGGEDVRDRLLVDGYDELRKCHIEGTYSLACALLALEAHYTPPGEWQELRAGRLEAPMARNLTASDRALMAEWTKTLLGNIDTTVDAAYLRRWHYGPSTSFDNSNTQYALLGLFAAQLCGIEISPQVWTAAGNHWLKVRIQAGDPAAPQLVSHLDLEKQQQGKGTRARGNKVPVWGWAYGGSGEPTGSMTCAGVTGLTLCAAALRAQKKGNPKLLHEFEAGVRSGFLWLQHNLSVRRNAGPPGSWTSWYYYYLYGLERSCELNQYALLGDRDWYFDGALQILGQQRADGSWGMGWDSCFALLFLKKTALPAITPR